SACSTAAGHHAAWSWAGAAVSTHSARMPLAVVSALIFTATISRLSLRSYPLGSAIVSGRRGKSTSAATAWAPIRGRGKIAVVPPCPIPYIPPFSIAAHDSPPQPLPSSPRGHSAAAVTDRRGANPPLPTGGA